MKTVLVEIEGQRSLTLDVFEPAVAGARTAVLIFHGGGLRFGSRAAVHSRAELLASLGFTTFAAEYRLLDEAPWPAQYDDACAVINFVRDHADDFEVDADRIVLQGHSAGGHLALLAGTKCRAAAVVAYYATIGFHAGGPPAAVAGSGRPTLDQAADGTISGYNLFGADPTDEVLSAASPIRQIRSESPPTLIFHGGGDRMLQPSSSVRLYERLLELGVECDLHVYSGQAHEFDLAPSMLDVVARETALFIRRTVTERDAMKEESRTFNPTFARGD